MSPLYTETVNVTLSLPDEIVREARHRAVERGVSLSRYLSDLLAEHIASDRTYQEAKQRYSALLEKTRDRGTGGHIAWTREALRER